MRASASKGLVGDNVVLLGHEDDQCDHGANQKHGDINGKRLNQPLLHGVLNVSGSSGMRAGALSGFVRINTTLHAPADGSTKAHLRTECIADNQGETNVGNSHERHYYFSEVGDALDAVEDDKVGQKQGECGGRQAINADFTGNATIGSSAFTDDLHHGVGHAVGLRVEQENATTAEMTNTMPYHFQPRQHSK